MFHKTYNRYINSPEWAQLKSRYRLSGRSMECFVCLDKRADIDFHHLTYVRLGHEDLNDIVPCCSSCHWLIHSLHRSQDTHNRRTVNQISEFVRDNHRTAKTMNFENHLRNLTPRG